MCGRWMPLSWLSGFLLMLISQASERHLLCQLLLVHKIVEDPQEMEWLERKQCSTSAVMWLSVIHCFLEFFRSSSEFVFYCFTNVTLVAIFNKWHQGLGLLEWNPSVWEINCRMVWWGLKATFMSYGYSIFAWVYIFIPKRNQSNMFYLFYHESTWLQVYF